MRPTAAHLRVAVPWGLLAGTVGLVAALLAAVAHWPATVWPLHGTAIGLIAGVSAWATDERCAAIVDVAPRPLWWRSLVRATAPALLIAVWTAAHLGAHTRLPDHLDLLVLQGIVAATLGFAAATARRAVGTAEPGHRLAAVVVPVAIGLALARPASDRLPLFPVWPHEDWERAMRLWAAAAVIGAMTLLAVAWRDARPRRSGRP